MSNILRGRRRSTGDGPSLAGSVAGEAEEVNPSQSSTYLGVAPVSSPAGNSSGVVSHTVVAGAPSESTLIATLPSGSMSTTRADSSAGELVRSNLRESPPLDYDSEDAATTYLFFTLFFIY